MSERAARSGRLERAARRIASGGRTNRGTPAIAAASARCRATGGGGVEQSWTSGVPAPHPTGLEADGRDRPQLLVDILSAQAERRGQGSFANRTYLCDRAARAKIGKRDTRLEARQPQTLGSEPQEQHGGAPEHTRSPDPRI